MYELFPTIYAQKQESLMNRQLKEAESKIQQKYAKKKRRYQMSSDMKGQRAGCLKVWRWIASIVCAGIGAYELFLLGTDLGMQILMGVLGVLGGLLAGVIVGSIVGLLFYLIFYLFFWMSAQASVQQLDELRDRIRREVAAQQAKLRKETDDTVRRYQTAFDHTSQVMSGKFKRTETIVNIVRQLSSMYVEKITRADVSAHIAKVVVPFEIKVYPHCITADKEMDYDFETNRCAELKDAVTQSALARLFAMQVQATVQMHCQQCGVRCSVFVEYKYPEKKDFSSVKQGNDGSMYPMTVLLTYTAMNPNYRAIQSW
jgi:hypothetical protein